MKDNDVKRTAENESEVKEECNDSGNKQDGISTNADDASVETELGVVQTSGQELSSGIDFGVQAAIEDGEVVILLSRRVALNRGLLIDISQVVREAGIGYPTAVSRRAWDELSQSDRDDELPIEPVASLDECCCLHDVASMLRHALRTHEGRRIIPFVVYVPNDDNQPKAVPVEAVFEPGDDGDPVITIRIPGER